MKNLYPQVLCVLLLCLTLTSKAQVKIGDNPNTINQNSILELESANKGLVFPHVVLTDVSASDPLANDLLTGTVVFNTNVATTGGSGPGLYAWDGAKWQALTAASSLAGSWQVAGNTSTNSAANFLGTTDNAGLSVRTANTEAIHIDSLQNVSVGIGSTKYKFEESGTFRLHTDSFNVMYDPDLLSGFIPGFKFVGAVYNKANNTGKMINGVFNPPAGGDAGKIIKGVVKPPAGGSGGVSIMGNLDLVNQNQDVVSAQPGIVSISSIALNNSSNINAYNTGQIILNTRTGNDTSNNFQLSRNGINFSNNVNNVGSSGINLNSGNMSFNVNSINNKSTAVFISPANYILFNNDNTNSRNSSLFFSSANYNLNISDNNLQTNLGQSASATQVQFNINDNLNNTHSIYTMGSTFSLSLNPPNKNSGLNITADQTNFSKQDFSQNKSSNLILTTDNLSFSLNDPSNNSNVILANSSATFTSNNGYSVGIGTDNPQANLDVEGTVRSSVLTGGGTVMADNNGNLYIANNGTKTTVNFVYNFSDATLVPAASIDVSGSGSFTPGVTDVIITIPSNTLNNSTASVSVSPDQDLPPNVSIASARLISTSEVEIRFLNSGTSDQNILMSLFITINGF